MLLHLKALSDLETKGGDESCEDLKERENPETT